MIAEIIEALSRNRPDVFVVDFSCADENGQNIVWIPCPFAPVHGKLMTGAEFFRRYYETTYVWLYILRRDLINQHGLRFQPRINMQDAELLPKIMAVTDQVLVSGIQAYVYVKRSDSYINNPDLGVRARYFSSVVEVRRRLIEFLYKLEEPMIMEGVNSKLNAINKILLLAYLYDPIDKKALSERLELLRNDGAYPFKRIRGGNLKIELLRFATNLYPTSFPRVYRGIRECFRSSQRSVT
ncbi:MAG TPA: hypothetical protein PKD55_20370 [Bellilinea sp.]|nr:hypothetical protein [Bellilinea sp.]